jgi:signal transduction histidine kinase
LGKALAKFNQVFSQRSVLRLAVAGFALLVFLVIAAAYVGFEGSRTIQRSAQEMVREHLVSDGRGTELEAQIENQSELLIRELGLILGGCLLLAVGCSVAVVWVMTRTLSHLDWQTAELDRVSWHMLEDQERTARRFSHEMHDELGQALTGLKGMAKHWTPQQFENGRKEFVQLLDNALGGVRELSQLLRPVILDDFGLDAGLRWLCSRFSERTGIAIDYRSTFSGRLLDTLETHLFRITQEALTNVARHSGATHVTVSLDALGSAICLQIEDNGRGLVSEDLKEHPSLGMVGMRARARHVGGVLRVERPDVGGLRIKVEAPLVTSEEELDIEEPHAAKDHPHSAR